ncbi:MAG: hypothetical protein PHI93_10475 [Kiritimatiellae bacterium]|nr:hypothetical protein [Kiritimatiellia bacterium]
MSSSSAPSVGGRILRLLCLSGVLAATTLADSKPYVESVPVRGFHLFTRPRKKDPTAQWDYVQSLDRAHQARAAARQAYALRLFWPYADEAPQAQQFYARSLDRRNRSQQAFDAYQHLVETYPGRFDFNEVLTRQMYLAKAVMKHRKGKFLFLPGFTAPERAIPLFEKIVQNAPEGAVAAEAYYLIGQAHERIYEYPQAIDAYFTTLNRFPTSPFAEPAAYGQASCQIRIAEDSPQDNRAVETAIAACDFYLQRYLDQPRADDIRAARQVLLHRQARNAFARAHYYDHILKQPAAALIEYRAFLADHANAEQAADARQRIQILSRQLDSDAPPPPPQEH